MSLRLTDFEEIHSSIFSEMLGMFAVSKQVDQNFSSVFVAFCLWQKLELEYSERSFSCTEESV